MKFKNIFLLLFLFWFFFQGFSVKANNLDKDVENCIHYIDSVIASNNYTDHIYQDEYVFNVKSEGWINTGYVSGKFEDQWNDYLNVLASNANGVKIFVMIHSSTYPYSSDEYKKFISKVYNGSNLSSGAKNKNILVSCSIRQSILYVNLSKKLYSEDDRKSITDGKIPLTEYKVEIATYGLAQGTYVKENVPQLKQRFESLLNQIVKSPSVVSSQPFLNKINTQIITDNNGKFENNINNIISELGRVLPKSQTSRTINVKIYNPNNPVGYADYMVGTKPEDAGYAITNDQTSSASSCSNCRTSKLNINITDENGIVYNFNDVPIKEQYIIAQDQTKRYIQFILYGIAVKSGNCFMRTNSAVNLAIMRDAHIMEDALPFDVVALYINAGSTLVGGATMIKPVRLLIGLDFLIGATGTYYFAKEDQTTLALIYAGGTILSGAGLLASTKSLIPFKSGVVINDDAAIADAKKFFEQYDASAQQYITQEGILLKYDASTGKLAAADISKQDKFVVLDYQINKKFKAADNDFLNYAKTINNSIRDNLIKLAREEFDAYGAEWIKINPFTKKEMFNMKTGGYVVTNTQHNNIYSHEFSMAEAFANDGKKVKLLSESASSGIKTPDAEIIGEGIWDFKNISRDAKTANLQKNIQDYVLGTRKQADNMSLNLLDNPNLTMDMVNNGVNDAINTAKAGGITSSLPDKVSVVYKNGTTKILTIQEIENGAKF